MDKIIMLLAFADVLLALLIVLVHLSGRPRARARLRMLCSVLRWFARAERK